MPGSVFRHSAPQGHKATRWEGGLRKHMRMVRTAAVFFFGGVGLLEGQRAAADNLSLRSQASADF